MVTYWAGSAPVRLGHTTYTYSVQRYLSRLDLAVWGLASERWYCFPNRTYCICKREVFVSTLSPPPRSMTSQPASSLSLTVPASASTPPPPFSQPPYNAVLRARVLLLPHFPLSFPS